MREYLASVSMVKLTHNSYVKHFLCKYFGVGMDKTKNRHFVASIIFAHIAVNKFYGRIVSCVDWFN